MSTSLALPLQVEAFIIHLRRAERRRPQAERLAAILPMPVTILDAVDGLQLSDDDVQAVYRRRLHRPRYPFELRRTEVGCFLSHRKAWREIVDRGLDAGLIVEDDVELGGPHFDTALQLALQSIRPGDYIRFPYRDYTDKGKIVAQAGEARLVHPRRLGAGMQMQLVGRQAATALLKATEVFDRPVDTTIQLRQAPAVRVLAMHPPIIRQIGHLLGGSVVQKKTRKPLDVLSREIKRASYRLALRLRQI
jgi:GR25 family glycosyltransferase involved in LPS biosynthesis